VAFAGDNGGATYDGVTASTITIVDRDLPDNALLGPGAPSAAAWAVAQVWLAYFNRVFELYGRQVVLKRYKSPHGDQLNEAQSQGQDAACEDAIAMSQELHAFAVWTSASPVFEQCAAQHHVSVLDANGRPTETFLDQYHPYLWTFERPCFRLADQIAEYVRKRLVGRPAIYAGDAAYRTKTRRVGIFVPDNEIYKPCIHQAIGEFGTPIDEFDFTADAARIPDEALQAAIHFKANGVTTIVISDPTSARFLIGAAQSEHWYPEWVVDGVGNDDTSTEARQFDASEVDGHLFGESEYSSDADYLLEPTRLYTQLTGKALDTANVYDGYFYELLQTFRLLQAAGPHLTPDNIARGALSLPERRGPMGTWSYNSGPDGEPGQIDHGSQLDANEIYWDANARDLWGGQGDYVVSKKRYRSGQWPTTPPEIYPHR
jgi:hypothetical protein